MSCCLRALFLAVLLLGFASASPALTFTFDATDSGFHDQAGNHVDTTNENYNAGWADEELRNFLVFDVSGLPVGETVLSVTLRLYNPAVGEPDVTYTGGYDSPDATETYEVRELLLPGAVVTAPSVLDPTVYTAIGLGQLFGSATMSPGDNGQFVDITLNAAAIAAVDAAAAEFVLGGLVSSLASALGTEEFVFGHTDPLDDDPGSPYARQLCVTTTGGPDSECFAPIPEPGTGALVALALIGVATARRWRFRSARVLGGAALIALIAATAPGAASAGVATTEIKVLSNRADLISGGDALIEIVPAPPPGTVIMAGAANVTGSFSLGAGGHYRGLVSGLAQGTTLLTVTLPDSSGASIAIDNHPTEGPVFSGPHLQPWDCKTSEAGLGQPIDANCNAIPLVEWLCSTGGDFASCDPNNPPANLEILTLNGNPVRAIVRRETGAINRGLYAFAVLHDPAEAQAPWIRQDGWNGKLYYPFGVSCNTNQTQGSSKADTVTVTNRLKQGFAIATTSLNELGHHCNPIVSAETAMMTKERLIEQYGPIRYTISTGASGGSIGQLQVSNAYPGITNGLIPSLTYPDVWSTAIEVADCLLTETYWPKAAVPFTPQQKSAVDGHGPTPPGPGLATACEAWVALFVPSGIPSHGCFSGSTLPTTSTPDPARDYNPATNPEGCRATVNDLQVNVWGRRGQDGFAKRPIDNVGVQYGLEALNLPVGNAGKITMAQFIDLNLKIGGVDIDGVPTTSRTRTDPDVSRIAYRTSNIDDTRGLAQAAILDLPSPSNAEIHTPYHAYATEARLAAIGHADNHAIWHAPGVPLVYAAGFEDNAFATMEAWLSAVEAAGGITATGMDPAVIKANAPATAYDSCWTGGPFGALVQGPLSGCASEVYGDARRSAGMSAAHDTLECQLEPISAADYAGAVPPPTAVDLALLAAIFPQGVCDYTGPPKSAVPSVQWLTYENGPGGQPLGPVPTSTPF